MATKKVLLSLLLVTAFVYSSARAVTDFFVGGLISTKNTDESADELND